MKVSFKEIREIIREELILSEKTKLLEQKFTRNTSYPLRRGLRDASSSDLIKNLQISLGIEPDGYFGEDTEDAIFSLSGYRDVVTPDEIGVIERIKPRWDTLDSDRQTRLQKIVTSQFAIVRKQPAAAPEEVDFEAAAEVEETAPQAEGEGTIDGMSVEDWLTTYWTARGGPHQRGTSLDIGVGSGILSVISESRKYATLKTALDETYSPARSFTSDNDYIAPPGNSSNPHYHLEIASIAQPETDTFIDEMFGDDNDAGTYLKAYGNTRQISQDATMYIEILAGCVKLLREQGQDVGKVRITSGFRNPRNQAQVMIKNWGLHGGLSGGTNYLVGLYTDDLMAKAVGKGLEGATVDATLSGRAVALNTIDMGDGRGPLPHNEITPVV